MMSAELIRRMSRESGLRAAREGKTVFVVTREDLLDWRAMLSAGTLDGLSFPFLGDHRPKGYERVDTYFVDGTGFGPPEEPAITFVELVREKLKCGYGYAIIGRGRFQVVVGEFLPEDPAERERCERRARRGAGDDGSAGGGRKPPNGIL